MLPIDSKRWNQLQGTYGSTTAHKQIRDFVNFLDDNPPGPELDKHYREFEDRIYDELSHQQSTWSATTAAMPHLLDIAKRLPVEFRCQLLESCGIMHFDGAGLAKDVELVGWYDEAINQAALDAIAFADSSNLKESEQFQLYCAIATFNERSFDEQALVFYAFRDYDDMDFECAHCNTKFLGTLTHNGCECVFKNSGQQAGVFLITPSANLSAAVARDGQTMYTLIAQLAIKNCHNAIVRWLEKRLGDFDCPHCTARSWAVPSS